MLTLRKKEKQVSRFAERCEEAVAELVKSGRKRQDVRLLAYYPKVKRNPFLQMLYSEAPANGYACVPLSSPAEVSQAPAGVPVLIHYHWLHRIFDGLKSARAARKAAKNFIEHVKAQKAAGVTIIWTVHNILSHGAKFPMEEQWLCDEFAMLADHIHIMNPATARLCEPYYHLPAEKLFHVPHPSYVGVYADDITKEEARAALGLQTSDKVFLLFGAMIPQKGTRHFLAGLDALREKVGPGLRVLIAGRPGGKKYMKEIQAFAEAHTDILVHPEHIEDERLQIYFKAADVVVCPYIMGLNSGVMLTAASFGRPAVAPDFMGGEATGAHLYPGGDWASCYEVCAVALRASSDRDIDVTIKKAAIQIRSQLVSSAMFQSFDRANAGNSVL